MAENEEKTVDGAEGAEGQGGGSGSIVDALSLFNDGETMLGCSYWIDQRGNRVGGVKISPALDEPVNGKKYNTKKEVSNFVTLKAKDAINMLRAIELLEREHCAEGSDEPLGAYTLMYTAYDRDDDVRYPSNAVVLAKPGYYGTAGWVLRIFRYAKKGVFDCDRFFEFQAGELAFDADTDAEPGSEGFFEGGSTVPFHTDFEEFKEFLRGVVAVAHGRHLVGRAGARPAAATGALAQGRQLRTARKPLGDRSGGARPQPASLGDVAKLFDKPASEE